MASKHARKASSRTPIPRRTTKGPLDEDDPLSASNTPTASPMRSVVVSPSLPVPESNPEDGFRSSALPSPSVNDEPLKLELDKNTKDLSFLLDPSIYHPLSQLDIPAPFRRPFPPLPASVTPISQSLSQVDALLARSDFLSAAHLAGGVLASESVKPTDTKTIFRLLAIRLSCLELTGNTLLAAQESKALEDLISTFYYVDSAATTKKNAPEEEIPPPEHIMPFPLRLQALRLQSIGFSDPRRGISALYELANECREHATFSGTSASDRSIWLMRLQETGIRVVNALIEMGEVDCARRTLESQMKDNDESTSPERAQRLALLYLRIGDVKKASAIIDNNSSLSAAANTINPLLAIAEGRYSDAAQLWQTQLQLLSEADEENEDNTNQSLTASPTALVKQNLAVAYLYSREITRSRELLHELIEEGYSFESLTVNLATLCELTSDRARELKVQVAGEVAAKLAGIRGREGLVLGGPAFKL